MWIIIIFWVNHQTDSQKVLNDSLAIHSELEWFNKIYFPLICKQLEKLWELIIKYYNTGLISSADWFCFFHVLGWCKCVNHSYLVSRAIRMKSGRRWRIWEMTCVSPAGSVENDEVSVTWICRFFSGGSRTQLLNCTVSLVQIVFENRRSVIYISLCVFCMLLQAFEYPARLCLLQKEPSSDVNSSSPRLSPPPKRTRRQTPPSSTDTSPSPQSKGQRGPWTMSKHCTRWGLTIYVVLHE